MRTLFLTIITFILPALAHAQGVKLLEKGVTGSSAPSSGRLAVYLGRIFGQAITIVSILAVILLMIAGVQYALPSAGADDKSEAKDRMWRVIVGLVLALGGYIILRTINPALVEFNQNVITPLNGGESTTGSDTGNTGGGTSAGGSIEEGDGGNTSDSGIIASLDDIADGNPGQAVAQGGTRKVTIAGDDVLRRTLVVEHATDGTTYLETYSDTSASIAFNVSDTKSISITQPEEAGGSNVVNIVRTNDGVDETSKFYLSSTGEFVEVRPSGLTLRR